MNKRFTHPLVVLRSRSGLTLVDIVIAFVVLVLLFLMFTTVFHLTSGIITKSDTVHRRTEQLLQSYYLGQLDEELVGGNDGGVIFQLTDGTTDIDFPISVYSYSDSDGQSIYTFGQHTVTVENGGS